MRIPRTLLVAGCILLAIPAVVSSGCGSDGGGGPGNAIVASWEVTSFVAQGTDAIANGMTFTMVLGAGGTYTFTVTNDQVGICDPNPDCTDTGQYAYTASTVTFDPGDPDEVVLSYSIQGNTMTISGQIDGFPVTITLERI